jgi:acetylornithine deacetylase
MPDPEVIALARSLVAIESVNPGLWPAGSGETAMADFCAEWLRTHGFEVTRLEATPGRPSLVGLARGSGGGRSLMLNGHLDTVGVATYLGDPFDPLVRDGRLHGRGSFDMKSGVAAALIAAARAASVGLRGDVLVALVADEELGSLGTEEVLRAFRADGAIVVEPSSLEIVETHRGFAWFEVVIHGVAAHGSQPELGVDAIAHAGRVMEALDGLRARLEERPRHPLLGFGTVRVATIQGGTDAATVAPSCTMTLERRTLPGETPDAVEAELRATIDATGVDYTLTRIVARAAFESDPMGDLSLALATSGERVLGRPVARRGEPFWTDAGLYQEAGIPCVLIGVDGAGAHADEEWATVESIERLAAILQATIADLCG